MNSKIIIGIAVVGITLLIIWKMLFSSPTTNLSPSQPSSPSSYTGGLYTDYDESKLASLSGDIVLFFHADWCPTCIAAEQNFLASGIPAGLTILKVDFDTATELKKKYTILTQTSFVLIKPDGTMIKRRVGGLTIQDILDKVGADTIRPNTIQATGSGITATAYFAGGCFRCMEGPFESLDGVKEVINGYIGGDARNANYTKVSLGVTKHKEAVKVVYDPSVISYAELLDTYRRQIDPTDAGGQFADRGSQYRTAIYYATAEEEKAATMSKQKLEASGKFSKPIVVEILPVTPFYPAEEYHQDYYKKNADHYNAYKKGSGRKDFIETNWTGEIANAKEKFNTTITSRKDKKPKTIEDLTAEQRRILFEGGTEPAFHNAYRDNHADGIYVDVIDGTPLFSSTDKFDSGTGWPSFSKPIDQSMVSSQSDTSHFMVRTEVKSATSSGHLGHIFDDGPAELGGTRYCINSAALEFVPLEKMKEMGYGEYLKLFNK